jgi:cellulose synthase (UDP-forming)
MERAMNLLKLWKRIGSSSGLLARLFRLAVYGVSAVLAYECMTVRFDWQQQAILGLLTVAVAIALHRLPRTNGVTLVLIGASIFATCRYAVWRVRTVYEAVSTPGHSLRSWDLVCMFALLGAEGYAFLILILGYIQTLRPLRRPSVPLPRQTEEWPAVDILIPTYNEPLAVVRSTAFAALNVDYPPEKMHVYLLDDGRREEFRLFAEEIGVGYIARKDNKHAKAGNINHALGLLSSPLVAIFDCDHVPTRSFLQVTVGWFLRDQKLGMLQTPHYFYSPDPFERNLGQYKRVPNEGELFYGILQDGNDLWNATFFCGSCAVLRRSALNEIGGIATETVTEDAHTSLRMQKRGWNTAYINIPQAAGLATESLSRHVGQRIRWARGMIQILRTDNPLFVRGLKWPQRLCYFNAMMHFLYAAPRLIFLTAPLAYMLFGIRNIPGYWLAITAYALPHLVLSSLTNSRIQGECRHSFWNEVYETVLAPYILGPTLLALVNPKLGKFNVTSKGGVVDKTYFDRHIARPYTVLLLINFVALAIAPWRYMYGDAAHRGAVLMNVFWIAFNCIIVGTANAVAIEAQQRRNSVRIDLRVPTFLRLADGTEVAGESSDLSLGGGLIQVSSPSKFKSGDPLEVVFRIPDHTVSLPVFVVHLEGQALRFQYKPLSLEQEELLTLVLYSRADTWLARDSNRVSDRPLESLIRISALSLRGMAYALSVLIPRRRSAAEAVTAGASAALLVAVALGSSPRAWAQSNRAAGRHPAAKSGQLVDNSTQKTFHSSFSLADFGEGSDVELHGANAVGSIGFALPQSEIVERASLHLQYAFSPKLIAQASHLDVLLNQTLVATLPVPAGLTADSENLSADLTLPAELMARTNQLTFRFSGHDTNRCEDPADRSLWAKVDHDSRIDADGLLLPLASDLHALPLPFYDGQLSLSSVSIQFAMAQGASPTTLEAAGMVASWFGVQANSKHLLFPVTLGSVPEGNVVVFGLYGSPLLTGLGVAGHGPSILMRSNPADRYGKLLIFAGDSEDELLTAAQSLAIRQTPLEGSDEFPTAPNLPALRKPDDAPRWLQAEQNSSLWSYSGGVQLRSDGSETLPAYIRMPPDLFWGDRQEVPLHLGYSYNAAPLASGSFLRLTVNGSPVDDLPLSPGPGAMERQDDAVPVPVSALRPFSNSVLFHFYFQPVKSDPCASAFPANLNGTLMRGSHLDLTGVPHWATLPNLELFANAGFPFTRFADLSQTVAVLPAAPTADEVSIYLTLVAYFGAQTGYPALRLEVGNAGSLEQDKDLLVIGRAGDQPAIQKLNGKLPVSSTSGLLSAATADRWARVQGAWWQIAQLTPDGFRDLTGAEEQRRLAGSLDSAPGAVFEAIESPTHPGRSIVVVDLQGEDEGSALAAAFLRVSDSAEIHGSLSILNGDKFSSFQIVDHYYHLGSLPVAARVRFWFQKLPWLGVAFIFLIGLLMTPWVKIRLDRRAEARLRVGQA